TLSAQVQVAKRRIDLVIESDGTRLAVECDGEAWHGPEQFADDLFRQRQLERAGWRFARVRESLFYSDRERALAEVAAMWDELDAEVPAQQDEGGGSYTNTKVDGSVAEMAGNRETAGSVTDSMGDAPDGLTRRDEESVDEGAEEEAGRGRTLQGVAI